MKKQNKTQDFWDIMKQDNQLLEHLKQVVINAKLRYGKQKDSKKYAMNYFETEQKRFYIEQIRKIDISYELQVLSCKAIHEINFRKIFKLLEDKK